MPRDVYRYEFAAGVPLEEVEATLVLAVLATEGLFGEAEVRLDAGHYFDPGRRACVIDAGTAAGRALNKLFLNFVRREFGEDAFRVERIAGGDKTEREETHA